MKHTYFIVLVCKLADAESTKDIGYNCSAREAAGSAESGEADSGGEAGEMRVTGHLGRT